MTHIVLVHGAFHTGECWYRLTPILEQRGFVVHTPTLRGQRGNPRHPLLVGWETYAEDITSLAAGLGQRAVLLGHSLGGFSISAAAERRPDLFSRLIYLCAAVPKLGRSTLRDTAPSKQPDMPRPKPGFRAGVPPKEVAASVFYNVCPPDVQAKAAALLSPQPLRPMLSGIKTSPARLGNVEKHYFECLQDRVIPIGDQRRIRSNLAFKSVQTLDSDHSPFLSTPEALAEAIERVCA